MNGYRHPTITPSPRLYVAGGIVCIGIALLMSSTFMEANWSNIPTVGVVIALMAVSAIGGVLLLIRGLTRLKRRALLEELAFVTPSQRLAMGENLDYQLTIKAKGSLTIDSVDMECQVLETAVEGEGMAPQQASLTQRKKLVKVARQLDPGESHTVKGSFELPKNLPATFRTEHQSVECLVRARLKGPEVGEMEQVWPIEIAPHLARAGKGPELDPAEPGDETLAELYSTELAGARLIVELKDAYQREGQYVLRSGETVQGSLVCDALDGTVELPDLYVALVFLTDGGFPDTRLVEGGVTLESAIVEDEGEIRLDFELPVPMEYPPSHQGQCVRVSWGLRVSHQEKLESDSLEYFPIEVLPAPASASAE